jgi:hypothetical protein
VPFGGREENWGKKGIGEETMKGAQMSAQLDRNSKSYRAKSEAIYVSPFDPTF